MAKKFQCPICNEYADEFRPFGLTKRKNAQCPNCGSLERHRLAWCFFRDKTNLFDGEPKVLLHVAPERIMSKKVQDIPGIDYLSADLDPAMAMVQMDLTDIQFPDETFDIILCSHVLEHIPDDRKAMSEMRRVLKTGGWAAVQVPVYGETTYEDFSITAPEEREKAFGQKDHVRKYGVDLQDRLHAGGFKVARIRYANSISPELRELYALRNQDIFYCTK